MSWGLLAANMLPNKDDLVDADTTDELQVSTGVAGFSTAPSDQVFNRGEMEAWVNVKPFNTSDVPTSDSCPNRTDFENARLWDPSENNDIPSGAGVVPHALNGAVVSWNDDGDVPTWARASETRVQVIRSVNGGAYAHVAWVAYGQGQYTDRDFGISGQSVCYRMRYRSLGDPTQFGNYTTAVCTTAA